MSMRSSCSGYVDGSYFQQHELLRELIRCFASPATETEDMTRGKEDKEYNVLLENFGRFVHLFGPFKRRILTKVRHSLFPFAAV